ncbi:MAG: MFS transporter [Gammaproteobacteria bacterium]
MSRAPDTDGPVANASLLGLLVLLYFAQGLPSGLLAKALPSLLREQGVSLSAIGFTGLLAVPWALKFLWAPFVDRWGTRRRWLLAMTFATLVLMLLVATRDFAVWVDNAFMPLLCVLLLVNLVAATQDIATDGLAVSRLTPRLRGLGNSIQVIGYKVGMIVGGGFLLWLVARFGWQTSYVSIAPLLLPVLVALWFMREPGPLAERERHAEWHGIRGYAGMFIRFVGRPGLGWWLLAVATFKVGDSLASRMIGPLLTDRGLSLAEIGLLTGVAGSVAGMLGALLGGMFLLRMGHRNALMLFGALQATGLAGYAWLASGTTDAAVLYLVVCGEQFADGLSTVALFTLMMDVCRPQSPGTDYSLQASLHVTVAGLASLASGVVAQLLGYGVVFAAGAALTLFALLPVWLYFRAASRTDTVAA